MALSTGQKWLVGCGGCLGVVVLIIAIIIGALAVWHQSSVDMVARMMGKEPSGYMTLLGMEDKKLSFAMLMSPAEQDMLVVIKSPADPELEYLQKLPDTKDPKKLAEIQLLLSKSTAASSGSVDKLQLEAITSFPVLNQRVKALDIKMNADGSVMPALAVVVPRADKQDVILFAFDLENQTTDSQADFTSAYGDLTQSMTNILSESTLLGSAPSAPVTAH